MCRDPKGVWSTKIEHKNRYEFVGLANAYAELGGAFFSLAGQSAPRNQSKLLRESQSYYKKSLNALRQAPRPTAVDPLGGDVTEQSVSLALSKCEASLNKLIAER